MPPAQQSSLEVEHIRNDHRISCQPGPFEKIEEGAFPPSYADWFYSLHFGLQDGFVFFLASFL